MVLLFLLGSVILLAISALFVFGALSQIIVCDSLNDPEHSQLFGAIQPHVGLQTLYPAEAEQEAPTLSNIIR